MPKWITTNWYNISYGWERPDALLGKAKNYIQTPEERLNQHLNELVTYLDKHQYTIRAVVPKTDGIGKYESGQNWGWGYGVTPITGFVVLAQQEREVSPEEYQRLSKAQILKNALPALREQCEKLQQAVDADKLKDLSISEKKKLLGGCKYLLGEKEFDSQGAAEAALASIQLACAERLNELEKTKTELESMESEIKELEDQAE